MKRFHASVAYMLAAITVTKPRQSPSHGIKPSSGMMVAICRDVNRLNMIKIFMSISFITRTLDSDIITLKCVLHVQQLRLDWASMAPLTTSASPNRNRKQTEADVDSRSTFMSNFDCQILRCLFNLMSSFIVLSNQDCVAVVKTQVLRLCWIRFNVHILFFAVYFMIQLFETRMLPAFGKLLHETN